MTLTTRSDSEPKRARYARTTSTEATTTRRGRRDDRPAEGSEDCSVGGLLTPPSVPRRGPGSGQPRGSERETAPAAGIGLAGQHLVQLDLVDLEPQPRAGHVQAPR